MSSRPITSERWRRNRAFVAPPGALEVDLPRSRTRRERLAQRLTGLPAGTAVVLCAAAPFARRRCRRFALRTHIDVTREYLAFPAAASPAYLVDDSPEPIRFFIQHALVAPPGVPLSLPIELGVGLVRAWAPTRLLRLLAPGRVTVGRLR